MCDEHILNGGFAKNYRACNYIFLIYIFWKSYACILVHMPLLLPFSSHDLQNVPHLKPDIIHLYYAQSLISAAYMDICMRSSTERWVIRIQTMAVFSPNLRCDFQPKVYIKFKCTQHFFIVCLSMCVGEGVLLFPCVNWRDNLGNRKESVKESWWWEMSPSNLWKSLRICNLSSIILCSQTPARLKERMI